MTLQKTYSPREIAESLGMKVEKVLHWIATKKLTAINVATSQACKKPRWRITDTAIKEFLLLRTTQPATTPIRRGPTKMVCGKSYF